MRVSELIEQLQKVDPNLEVQCEMEYEASGDFPVEMLMVNKSKNVLHITPSVYEPFPEWEVVWQAYGVPK